MKTKNKIEEFEDFDEFEDFFSENGVDAISAMSSVVSTQQNVALNLTTLVLDHCAKNKITIKEAKKEVFALYEEASHLVRGQLDL